MKEIYLGFFSEVQIIVNYQLPILLQHVYNFYNFKLNVIVYLVHVHINNSCSREQTVVISHVNQTICKVKAENF